VLLLYEWYTKKLWGPY